MITGTGSLSLKKQSLDNQTTPAVGFTKLTAAHLCSAGQTSINLNALTTPTQLSSAGFTQPNASTLTSANLLFYRKNLAVVSSLRGTLVDYLSYVISSNSVITLLYSAAENEILFLTVDYAAQTGIKVVDARPLNATGTLPINTTDFNVGTPFKVNQYSTTQIGAVLVFVDGVLQYRNTGNSSTVLDGNYYEVDGGNGLGTIIRFNVSNSNILNICVVSNGLLSERPDGSMMASIENIQGQINNMAPYVAAATGQTVNTVLGGAPSNQDLKAFGDRVVAAEADIDVISAKYTPTGAVGRTDGAAVPAGMVGQRLNFTNTVISAVTTGWTANGTPLVTLTPGVWLLVGRSYYAGATSSTGAAVGISTNSTNDSSGLIDSIYTLTQDNNLGTFAPMNPYYVSISSTTAYYAKATATGANRTVVADGMAIRIA